MVARGNDSDHCRVQENTKERHQRAALFHKEDWLLDQAGTI
jgi:hypothetical protein